MAMRVLWKDFGFAATAILILALALAVNVTAFRIMDATLLQGYPLVQDNERMMFIGERSSGARRLLALGRDFRSSDETPGSRSWRW